MATARQPLLEVPTMNTYPEEHDPATQAWIDALNEQAEITALAERGIAEIETFLAGVFDNA